MISDLMLYGTKVTLRSDWPESRWNASRHGADYRAAASGRPPWCSQWHCPHWRY
jgi:hypothetical protein